MSNGISPVPSNLDNDDLEQFLTQIRLRYIDILSGRVVALSGGTTGGAASPAPAAGPPGPPGPSGPPATYVPDLTPPPTPSGVSVTAGLDFVFITTDAPVFVVGNGYNRTLVYGATYSGTGPLPTFGDAVLVHEFVGQVGSFAAEPATQWHIWLKWRTNDAVLSVSPEGGANGHQVTTSLIGNADLGPLIIEAGNLAAGAVTTAKFAAGIEPVSIVGALPSAAGYTGPKTVLLTTDGKLYRYVAGAWTTAVPAVDITGQIIGTQITDGAITTPKLAAGSVTASTIAANTITANEIAANAITASELAANSVIAGKIAAAAISATEISAGAIQAVHLAANSIAVGTAAIQNGAIVNAMIGTAQIGDANIVALSASKILAGSLAVGEYIQSSGFTPGGVGFRIDGGGGAEFRFSGGTRVFHLGASGADPVLKVGSALEILSNGTATFSGALSAATGTFSGSLSAATGTFAGSLTAATGTFAGSLTAATGSFLSSSSGKRITLNEDGQNEGRFYGDRGDGTIEALASIGITTVGADQFIGKFGSLNTGNSRVAVGGFSDNQIAVYGKSNSYFAVYGLSTSGVGARGDSISSYGVQGTTSSPTLAAVWGFNGFGGPAVHGDTSSGGAPSTGPGVKGTALSGDGVVGTSTTGRGGVFSGNATSAALNLVPVDTPPATPQNGDLAIIKCGAFLQSNLNKRYMLCQALYRGDGVFVDWVRVSDGAAWNATV